MASVNTTVVSPSTLPLSDLVTPISFLCFLFFYVSLATFAFALLETIFGIISKDDNSLAWWRRSRLVALTYAQMYLSQHFLQTLSVEKSGPFLVEKSFWMASQSITVGVLLFSTIKAPRSAERLILGDWYALERPQIAQVVLTLVVAFNILLIAGPVACVLVIVGLLVGLDWKLLALLFESVAIFKTWRGSAAAELAWDLLHITLAIGTIRAIHNIDEQEGLISLPADEETAPELSEKTVDDEEQHPTETDLLPADHLFLRFCVLTVFGSAVIMTTFFALEKLLLPKLPISNDRFNAHGLVLSQMFTMDLMGVMLVLALTLRELYHNSHIQSICRNLCY